MEYETDRVRFLGRGRTPANPAALDPGAGLSGTTGPVLDPVFSLRRRIRLEPKGTAKIAFITGVADTREAAIDLAEHFREHEAVERSFAGARDRSRHELSELALSPDDVSLFEPAWRGAAHISPARRLPGPTPSPRIAWASRDCGRMPSREIVRLCWSELPWPTTGPLVHRQIGAAGTSTPVWQRPRTAGPCYPGRATGRPPTNSGSTSREGRPAARQAGRCFRPRRDQRLARRRSVVCGRGACRTLRRPSLPGRAARRSTDRDRPPVAARDHPAGGPRTHRESPLGALPDCLSVPGTALAGSRATVARICHP